MHALTEYLPFRVPFVDELFGDPFFATFRTAAENVVIAEHGENFAESALEMVRQRVQQQTNKCSLDTLIAAIVRRVGEINNNLPLNGEH